MIVALITAGSAPWWWDEVSAGLGLGAGEPHSEVTTPTQPSRQHTGQGSTGGVSIGTASSEC